MENFIMHKGEKIPLSEETEKRLEEAAKKKDPLVLTHEEEYYVVDRNAIASSRIRRNTNLSSERKLPIYSSRKPELLEKAEKYLRLLNYADAVNGEFEDGKAHVISNIGILSSSKGLDECIEFSSRKLAQQAIDYFGEDFFKELFK
jgi:hypothetical protein